MSFIGKEKKEIYVLTCSHPKVKKIWEWGGGASIPTNGDLIRNISILLDTGQVCNFKDDKESTAEEQIDKYLNIISDDNTTK